MTARSIDLRDQRMRYKLVYAYSRAEELSHTGVERAILWMQNLVADEDDHFQWILMGPL